MTTVFPTGCSQHKLKRALLDLIAAGGFEQTTASAIAKHAGLSRTAFYKHYHSKDELLQELAADIQEGFLNAILASFEHRSNLDFSKYPSSLPVLQYIRQHADFFGFLFGPHAKLQWVLDFHTFLQTSLTTELTLTPNTDADINAADTAYYLSLAVLSFIAYWVNSGFQYSAAELDRQLIMLHRDINANCYFTDSAFAAGTASTVREDRRIARTRSAIKESLLKLLQEGMPEKDISVQHIADGANIRRATFYDHYRNKTDLLGDMMDEIGSQIVRSLAKGRNGPEPQSLIEACDSIFRVMQSHQDFLEILDQPSYATLFAERLLSLLRRYYRESKIKVAYDHELYVHYSSGVILELVLSKTPVMQKASPDLTPAKLIQLINQKKYGLALV